MRFDRLTLPARLALGLSASAPLLLTGGCAMTPPGGAIDGPAGLSLYTQRFGERPGARVKTLVIIVNGDGPADQRTDDAKLAATLAARIPGSSVVALLRPGYADRAGHRSPGEMGVENGEHLGADKLQALAESITRVERGYPAARHILMASSGGAALVADLAGLYPHLADAIVLAGCPCTMPEWRAFRARQDPAGGWTDKVQALDPLRTAGGVDPSLRALLVVGADDRFTPPRFTRDYAQALALRGITTDFRILPGRGANVLDDPEVMAATVRLAEQLRSTP